MYGCEQDDPIIRDMDPVRYMWKYNNWVADQNEKVELAKEHAYLLASFWNPEAVRKIKGEGADMHISTDEEFEESTRMVRDINEGKLKLGEIEEGKGIDRQRRRRKII
jgi:hypothetical protein